MSKEKPKAVKQTVQFSDFMALDMRAGTVVRAEPFPEARKPAIKLWIDFGSEIGGRKTSAQITDRYQAEDLIGKQVIAVINFEPRQIGKFMSEVLVLGVSDAEGAIVLVSPNANVPNGSCLH